MSSRAAGLCVTLQALEIGTHFRSVLIAQIAVLLKALC